MAWEGKQLTALLANIYSTEAVAFTHKWEKVLGAKDFATSGIYSNYSPPLTRRAVEHPLYVAIPIVAVIRVFNSSSVSNLWLYICL
jgi:hypothetical protein